MGLGDRIFNFQFSILNLFRTFASVKREIWK